MAKYSIEQFDALSKDKRRVLIAQDVLAQIGKRYKAKKGRYIGEMNLTNDDLVGSKKDVRKNLDKITNCDVCALGACLLSTIKYRNSLTFEDINKASAYNKKVWSVVRNVFPAKEMFVIEHCFEGNHWGDRVAKNSFKVDLSSEISSIASQYYQKYEYADDRLRAIMTNIVRNKGSFIPEQDLQ